MGGGEGSSGLTYAILITERTEKSGGIKTKVTARTRNRPRRRLAYDRKKEPLLEGEDTRAVLPGWGDFYCEPKGGE